MLAELEGNEQHAGGEPLIVRSELNSAGFETLGLAEGLNGNVVALNVVAQVADASSPDQHATSLTFVLCLSESAMDIL